MAIGRERLDELREATNDILRILTSGFTIRPDYAVKSTVHCYSARGFVDDEGEEGLQILIDGASPDDSAFRLFVAGELRKREFGDVEIVAGW